MFGSFFYGATTTIPTAYKKGYEEGYVKALGDVKDILGEKGIDFSWKDLGEGKYVLEVRLSGTLIARGTVEVHLTVEHYRGVTLLSTEYGAGVLTTWGKNWIEQQLSGTLNSTQHALYLSDSNNASEPSASWTILPNEITTNGLDRQTGTYTSTGDGTWNVTKAKSVTGTQPTQLWGLNADPSDGLDGYLIAADSGPAQKNCVSGDTLTETWMISVS